MSDTSRYATDPTAEEAIRQLEVQAVNFAYRFINDSQARAEYMRMTKKMSEGVRQSYMAGDLTAKDAARTAQQMRNEILDFSRQKSSDVGRAFAKAKKAQGLGLDELVEKYAKRLYSRPFQELTDVERNGVYLKIVGQAGAPNQGVNSAARTLGRTARGLWVLTACFATYNIATSDNKVKQAGRELANVGGGIGGGAAGGAAVGVWFGGPIGVGAGVIIGGVLGAIMADQIYVEVAGPDGDFAKGFIPRFTSVFGVDEEKMATALYVEVQYELSKVKGVFAQLWDKYSTDADDVAVIYLKKVQRSNGATYHALRQNVGLRNLLIDILDSGWTSREEEDCIKFLRTMS